jgi:poly(A) polymerase Pap1
MPIVTPAYPAMNSSANVNAWSFAVLRDEFKRGSRICEEIVENSDEDPLKLWAPLLERTDFFDKYDAYLAVNVLGGDEESFNSFKGFLGSRLRKLVERLGYLPLRAIHLFPEEFERTTTEGLADYGGCWFLGIKEDVTRMEGETLILTHTWTEFWTEDVCKYRDLDDDLDVRLEHLTWEQLPDFVFGDDQDEVAVAKEVALERREVRHAREAEEEELLAVEEENPALKALKEAEENADAGTLKRAREEEAAEDEVKKPLAPTEARTLHDDADLPRLAAVLPPWHPLATTSRVPRSKKVQLELAS